MSDSRAESAAALLVEARRGRQWLPDLPEECRPRDLAEAWAVQDAVVRRLGGHGGWKVGAPGPTAEPSYAPIAASLVHRSPAVLPSGEHRLFGIEAEIGFRIGRDLPRRERDYTREEVLSAVAAMHPTIEVVESRFVDFRTADKLSVLADFQSNGALIVGPEATGWQGADLAQPKARLLFDASVETEVTTGNSAGDPIRLLVALANHAARRGMPLRSGDVVTTGSCTGLTFTKAGGDVVADFGAWGAVELRFT